MAGLLLCVMVSTPLLGCLIPQDEQVIGDLPPKRNSPLTIVSHTPPGTSATSTTRTTFYNSTSCLGLNQPFQLTAEDEDLADVVYSLWFIDKSTNGSSSPFPPSPVPPPGKPARVVTAPNALGFKSALANLSTGTHLLTVFVADSQFQEVVDGVVAVTRPDRLLPDGTLVPDIGSIDSFTWVLDVESCP